MLKAFIQKQRQNLTFFLNLISDKFTFLTMTYHLHSEEKKWNNIQVPQYCV